MAEVSDSDSSVSIETEEQLWNELEQVVATTCPASAHESIDDALRTWLLLASRCRDEFSQSEDDVAHWSQRLLEGNLFYTNQEYVRTQIVYSFLQEDDTGPLYVIATFLLLDGRVDPANYQRMALEGCFHRLLELINGKEEHDPPLHRLLLELMYEMSRNVKLEPTDLEAVDDRFITYLFQIVENVSDDAHDPYHYPIIRVLLVLNEQYMISSTVPDSNNNPLTNRVIKCLSLYGPLYRTFGENIILLFNRENETASQLLILKLLYLIFTTKATYEYFYTNDLRVLLDIVIRQIFNLPDDVVVMELRYTYMRVLYPFLAHTQLSQPPHYKRDEILRLLQTQKNIAHASDSPDAVLLRLIDRVYKVKWLADDGVSAGEVARKFLGISLSHSEAASSISIVDVAAVTEKPGVQTPSKQNAADADKANGEAAAEREMQKEEAKILAKPTRPRIAPEVPKHRHGTPYNPVAHLIHANGDGKVKKPPAPPPSRKAGRRGLKTAVSQTFEPPATAQNAAKVS